MTRAIASEPRVLSDVFSSSRVKDVILVVAYAGFIGLSAQFVIHLPFTPVPITGQTFAVLLGASMLGPIRSVLGAGFYLVLGLAGLPWFAGGTGGFSIVSAPSFGYLVGFVVAAMIVGAMAQRGFDKGVAGTAAEMVIGNLVIYAFGLIWLSHALGVSFAKAVSLGATPFLVGDLLKLVLAAVLLPSMWKLSDRFNGSGDER